MSNSICYLCAAALATTVSSGIPICHRCKEEYVDTKKEAKKEPEKKKAEPMKEESPAKEETKQLDIDFSDLDDEDSEYNTWYGFLTEP